MGLAAIQGAAMRQIQLACKQRRAADNGLGPGCAG